MLDVHAPHQTIHTWKDFLIHIAAIAIGLLLALGLEKVAEYVHEHYQLTAVAAIASRQDPAVARSTEQSN